MLKIDGIDLGTYTSKHFFQTFMREEHCCGVIDWRPHMHESGRGRSDLWRRVSRYASSQHKEYASYTVVLAVFFPDAEGVGRSYCFQMCLALLPSRSYVVERSDVARRRQWTRGKLGLALRVGPLVKLRRDASIASELSVQHHPGRRLNLLTHRIPPSFHQLPRQLLGTIHLRRASSVCFHLSSTWRSRQD